MDDERLTEAVSRLDIPEPFDVAVLVQQIAVRRQRPIELRPTRTPAGGPSGVWIATHATDFIYYEADTSKLHQEHIILHELGHLLMGHVSEESPDTVLRFLLPHLDPQVVRGVLRRANCNEHEERQAELFALLVLERAGRLSPAATRGPGPQKAAMLDRIEAALARRGG